jgi:hypothetical protein
MRSIFISIFFMHLVACAAPSEFAYQPSCDLRAFCFSQRNIRNIELIDNDTLVVHVGRNSCPYLVEVGGVFCNLTFSSTIGFNDSDGRICKTDNTQIISGPFRRNNDEVCRIRNVKAVTDDELLEYYAVHGHIPPLPPVGSGQLELETPQ